MLSSAALNSALWGIYVGPDSVVPEAKLSFGAALAKLAQGAC